jgi:Ser/Thr protein kinase RdoA (MazF antagonist)
MEQSPKRILKIRQASKEKEEHVDDVLAQMHQKARQRPETETREEEDSWGLSVLYRQVVRKSN